jgi:hypothetical protein
MQRAIRACLAIGIVAGLSLAGHLANSMARQVEGKP